MAPVNPDPEATFPLLEHDIEIRVRYQETDAQGRVHHGNFINYFEIGRVELLRAAGSSYRLLEESGLLLVVTEIHCNYVQPAEYDDLLSLKTRLLSSKGVRIKHQYQVTRGEQLIADGWSVVAAVSADGNVTRLPKWLRMPKPPRS